MIVPDKRSKLKSLNAILEAKNCKYYKILPTGDLHINQLFKSHVFIAYVCGNWFASYGEKKSASIAIPEDGLGLFLYGNNSLWFSNDNGDVDVSTPTIPLDQNTFVVLGAFSGKVYDIIIADGSKHHTVISTSLEPTQENKAFLAVTLTSLIRQYDDKAADEILEFWFQHRHPSESENELLRQILQEKPKNKKTGNRLSALFETQHEESSDKETQKGASKR